MPAPAPCRWLATPFALGSALTAFGRWKFFLKNSGVAEVLGRATTSVFDKTGTLTDVKRSAVEYTGPALPLRQQQALAAVVRQLTHPLSQRLAEELPYSPFAVTGFVEVPGQGLRGTVDGVAVKVGAASFVGSDVRSESLEVRGEKVGRGAAALAPTVTSGQSTGTSAVPSAVAADHMQSRVYVGLDGELGGCFRFRNVYRQHLSEVLADLAQMLPLSRALRRQRHRTRAPA